MRHTWGMSMSSRMPITNPLKLEYPQSLAVYDEYAQAQKAVDFLSDNKFPVEQCMIVGTDLKRVERITGRLTYNRVALGGALSGLWLGVFVGIAFALFTEGNAWARILSTATDRAVLRHPLGDRRLRRHPRTAGLLVGDLGGRHEVRGARRAQVRPAGARSPREAARRPPGPVRLRASRRRGEPPPDHR